MQIPSYFSVLNFLYIVIFIIFFLLLALSSNFLFFSWFLMVKSPITDLRSSFLFNGHLKLYISVWALLLSHPINFVMQCFYFKLSHFFNEMFNLFSFSLWFFFLWIICYWRVCCLISTYMQIFSFHFVIDFWFHSIVFGKDILYAFNLLNIIYIFLVT